ncbi:MAG TPA: AAA family ATPase [Ktedonosporobacter sp.]|nr:AAA family ATPase [Ktedonosporobacter sp.]
MPDPVPNPNSEARRAAPIRVPNHNEQAFLAVLHEVIKDIIFLPHEVSARVEGELSEAALQLQRYYQQGGSARFWAGYNIYCMKYPYLEDWRRMVDPSIVPPVALMSTPAYAETTVMPPTSGSEGAAVEVKIKDEDDLKEGAEQERAIESAPPVSVCLDDVEESNIDWLWKPRIALGKVTVIDGDPGLGKSLIAILLMALVTTGRAMPDETPGILGNAMYINAEDGLSDTIKPRLRRAGADFKRVFSLGMVPVKDKDGSVAYERTFLLAEDRFLLEDEVKRRQPKLLVLDPYSAIMGGRDTNKDSDVRMILGPLSKLAEEQNMAVIIIRHLNKSSEACALYRGSGSMSAIAMARSGLLVVRDPRDESRCLLAHIKNNIGEKVDAMEYRVRSDKGSDDEQPYIEWGKTVEISERDLFATPPADKNPTAAEEILQLLTECAPREMSCPTIAEELDLKQNTVRVKVRDLLKKRKIKQHDETRDYYVEKKG